MGRTVIKTVLFIILFILVIALLIQTPPVQNVLRKQAVAWMEKKLKTKVTVGKVFLGLPREVELMDVYIEDRNKDTLLSGGTLKANINLFRLIFGGDIDIRKLELDNITLKANRKEKDSVFNYQFFINAFTTRTTIPDPEDTTSFFIGIPSVELNNVRLVYNDAVTGSDIEAWIGHLNSRIDKFDPANFIVDVPRLNVEGFRAKVYQLKTLATPEPLSKDIVEARKPIDLRLDFNEVDLKDVYVDYRNDVSAFYSTLDIGALRVTPQAIDITNRVIILDSFAVHNSTVAFRFGKKEKAAVVVEEIKQELESQAKAGWRVEVASLNLDDNNIWYDNDNKPETVAGIDYAHIKVDSLTLEVDDFLL